MPSPDAMKQCAWTVAAIGFGCAYIYLAYSTRRLERLVADKPQLQSLMAVMDRWYIDGAIGIACLLVAVALWWQVIGEHINVPGIIQLATGAVFVLGGIGAVRVGAKLRSRPTASRGLVDALTSYVLPIAAILYGVARLGSGVYLLLK